LVYGKLHNHVNLGAPMSFPISNACVFTLYGFLYNSFFASLKLCDRNFKDTFHILLIICILFAWPYVLRKRARLRNKHTQSTYIYACVRNLSNRSVFPSSPPVICLEADSIHDPSTLHVPCHALCILLWAFS
jgi:hypothetical protein